ncbi:outer membrane beta-barrel protein [Chitinophagaceae bacterium MMS25-I14]
MQYYLSRILYLLMPAITLVTATVHAQEKYSLSGIVKSSDSLSVTDGGAYLLDAKGLVQVKYTGIIKGHFSFEPMPKATYTLKVISGTGENAQQKVVLDSNRQMDLYLNSGLQLNDVTVAARRKAIENRNGNLLVHIDNTAFAAAIDPADLLAKLPGVQVSSDGENITVIGKGEPLIYIGHQRATVADLKSLPVSQIKDIEIINNPPAKYEAAGRVVILITRKISHEQGFKTDLTEKAELRRRFRNHAEAGLAYKNKRLELQGNMQYNLQHTWESNSNDFNIPAQHIDSRYTVLSLGKRQQYIFNAGAYYQFTDEDYISLQASGRSQNEPFTIATNTSQLQAGTETNVFTGTTNYSSRPYFNLNLNCNKKTGRHNKGSLFAGGQFATYTRSLSSSIYNTYDTSQTALVQDRSQQYRVTVWTGRIDYEQQLCKLLKWESGINLDMSRSAALLDIRSYIPADTTHSDFRYNENIAAAYTQLSGSHGRISYNAGLRAEHTTVQGGYRDSAGLLVDKNYTKLFPKASITLQTDSTKSITLDYSRTIQRPDYAATSQITTYINPYFEWSGNINLSPAINDALAATFQYRNYSLQLSVYRQTNPVYDVTEYNEATGTLHMTERNLAVENGIRLDLTIPWTYRKWTSTNIISGIMARTEDPAAVAIHSRPYMYFYTSNQVSLPHNYTLTLNGWCITKRNEGIYAHNGIWAADIALSHTFFRKLSCTVSFNDIFRSQTSRERFTINGIGSDGRYYDDQRSLSVTLKYALGNVHDAKYRNKDVNDQAGRIK